MNNQIHTYAYQDESAHRSTSCKVQPFCEKGQYVSGNYGDATAAWTCPSCSDGYYQDASYTTYGGVTGQTHRWWSCKTQPSTMCGKGEKMPDVDSKVAMRKCESCGSNEYQDSSSHQSASCKAQPTCEQGKYMSADTKTAARACSDCGSNKYQDLSSHRSTSCKVQPTCGKGK